MRCPHCERPMLALFTSCVCEHCEGLPRGELFRGWVVWPTNAAGVVQTWVFRTEEDARKWLTNRTDGTVRAVLSLDPYVWTRSRGQLKDVTLAERPFEIYPDHRYPPADHRAFLAPPGTPDGDRIRLGRN